MSDNDLDFSLLDSSVDELADLKVFRALPIGSYKFAISWDKKALGTSPAVSLKLVVQEVLELADKTEVVEPGETAYISYALKKKDGTRNEMAEGLLKEVVKVLQPVFGGSTVAEVMERSEGASVFATTGQRADKDDKEKKYTTLKSVMIE